jgi:hypothetical protein
VFVQGSSEQAAGTLIQGNHIDARNGAVGILVAGAGGDSSNDAYTLQQTGTLTGLAIPQALMAPSRG